MECRELEACFAIGSALRTASTIDDAAGAIAFALGSAAGAKSAVLWLASGDGFRIAGRAGALDAMPASPVGELLDVEDRVVGFVDFGADAPSPCEALHHLIAHAAAEIDAFLARQVPVSSADLSDRDRMRVQELFMQAPALIVLQRGPDHILDFVNRGVQQAHGGRAVVGLPLRRVVEDEVYVATVDRVFRTGTRFLGTQIPFRMDWDHSGHPYERFFNVAHEPMHDFRGRVEGVMTVGFDVTDLVAARQRVEAMVSTLEATSRAKDEFLATVSHELRTPLSSIMGWSAFLRERCDDPEAVKKGATVIQRSVRAQAKIISDILDVSRIVTGKLRIDARPVDIGTLVREALEVVRPSATAKGIALSGPTAPSGCAVIGDEERLRQILWNLVSNAIKFTERGGHVEVRTSRDECSVRIEVEDSGRGIAQEFLPHVFERFRQADSSTTRAHAGIGLGLAIVRHLVELHGGDVAVTSEGVGKGATFSVTLPLGVDAFGVDALETPAPESAPQASAAPRTSSAPMAAVRGDLTGVNVLIVDDERDAREILSIMLETWGARVTSAASAAEALRSASAHAPDVLVSDIGMPIEDGYSLMAKLRILCTERHLQIPAIAMTAYAASEDVARAIASGFDFHVAKPVEPLELRALIERALRRKSADVQAR